MGGTTIASDDGNLHTLLCAARQAAMRGDRDGADAMLREASAAAPGHPRAVSELAMQTMRRGDAAAAHEALGRLCRTHPGETDAWFNLAIVCVFLNRTGEANAALDRVLDSEPSGTATADVDRQRRKKAAARLLRARLAAVAR